MTAGRYHELVRTLDAGVQLVAVPCPDLVPLIESDDPFGEATTAAVRRYAAPLKEAGVDTVILGCTHYPLIRPIFQRVFGRGVTLVFSAEETGREVAETLVRKGIENDGAREGAYRFLTTGDPDAFRALGSASCSCRSATSSTSRSRRSRRRHDGARRRAHAGRPAADARPRPGLHRARQRLGALLAGEDARALHGDGRGGRAAVARAVGSRLDDGRVLAAAGVDGRAHAA